MNIQTIETNTTVHSVSMYKNSHFKCDNVEIMVVQRTCLTGKTNEYFNVIVMNASNKVWKGGGKYFKTKEEAISNYKNEKIKAMISAF